MHEHKDMKFNFFYLHKKKDSEKGEISGFQMGVTGPFSFTQAELISLPVQCTVSGTCTTAPSALLLVVLLSLALVAFFMLKSAGVASVSSLLFLNCVLPF